MVFRQLYGILACASLCNAAIFTNTPADFQSVKAGTPFNITWGQASGPVTILLKNGDPTELKTAETIVSRATASSFIWTPETSLIDGLYAFEIDDASGPNYSVQFTLSGGSASISSSAASSCDEISDQTQTLTSSLTSTSTQSTIPPTTSSPLSSPSSSSSLLSSSQSSSASSQSSSTSTPSSQVSTSSPTSSTPNQQSSTSSPQPTQSSHKGLSTGAAAGIGIGATLGVLAIIGIIFFAFWYGRKSVKSKPTDTSDTSDTAGKAELGAGILRQNRAELEAPLNDEEKSELENRRRAAELAGVQILPVKQATSGSVNAERAELEALRKKVVYEM